MLTMLLNDHINLNYNPFYLSLKAERLHLRGRTWRHRALRQGWFCL